MIDSPELKSVIFAVGVNGATERLQAYLSHKGLALNLYKKSE